MVERDKGLCAGHTWYHLDFLVEKLHKMFVVAGKELDEHCVGTGCEMAFNNFGYFLEFGHNITVHGTALEVHTYISAGGVTEDFGVDMIARAGNDLHTAHKRHIFRRYAGIVHDYLEYLAVEIVYFFHEKISISVLACKITQLYENCQKYYQKD